MKAIAACAVLLLVALPALGHEAPDPRDMETRLLHDHNDDCGGDALAAGTHTCGQGHDLIALDMREAWDEARGETVVFRLIMAEGQGTMQDTISFKADGTAHTLTLRTSDDQRFTSADCDKVGQKVVVEAAAKRFAIDCTIALATLGVDVGDALSDFSVKATAGGEAGDAMPGANGGVGYDAAGDTANYARPRLQLRGPVQYVDVEPQEDSLSLRSTGEHLLVVDVSNRLDDQAQTVVLEAEVEGARARFHDAASNDYSASLTVDLPAGGNSAIHVALDRAVADASGTLRLVTTTDQGGRSVTEVPFVVGSGPAPGTTTTTSADGSNESPGAGVAVLAAGLLGVALLRRRR